MSEVLKTEIDIDHYLWELKDGYLRPKIEEIHVDRLGETKRVTIWFFEEKAKA